MRVVSLSVLKFMTRTMTRIGVGNGKSNRMIDLLLATLIAFTATANLTWYDPALGGVNCDSSCDYMAAGDPVADWYGRALACPPEFPLGTRFSILGSRWGLADGEWLCLDRGGSIVILDDGVIRLDLLTRAPIWRENVTVVITP